MRRQNRMWILSLSALFGCCFLATPPKLFAQKNMRMELNEGMATDSFKRANILFKKGARYYQKGDYKNAKQALLKCLHIAPQHAEARLILTLVNYRDANYVQALADIGRAKNDYMSLAHYKAGTEQQYLQLDSQQIKVLDESIAAWGSRLSAAKSDQERAQIQNLIADLQSQKMNLVFPSPDQPVLVETTPKTPAVYYFVHGNILLKLRKPDEAASQYRQAIQIDPTYINAYNNLASVLFTSGNYEQAIDTLNQAETLGLHINPDLKQAILKELSR